MSPRDPAQRHQRRDTAPRAPFNAISTTRRIRPPAIRIDVKRKKRSSAANDGSTAVFPTRNIQIPLDITDPNDTDFPPTQRHPQQRIEKILSWRAGGRRFQVRLHISSLPHKNIILYTLNQDVLKVIPYFWPRS